MKSAKIIGTSLIIGLMISIAATTPKPVIKNKKAIEGICKNSPVFDIKPTDNNGHVKAKAFKTDDAILKQLNRKVGFLKDKPNYQDKGTVELIINCRGKLSKCSMSNKTQDEGLDIQILSVFRQLKNWSPATMRARPVNSRILYNFSIKNGEITL